MSARSILSPCARLKSAMRSAGLGVAVILLVVVEPVGTTPPDQYVPAVGAGEDIGAAVAGEQIVERVP